MFHGPAGRDLDAHQLRAPLPAGESGPRAVPAGGGEPGGQCGRGDAGFAGEDAAVATQPGAADTVELVVADSGSGVSPDDKEKLFLPYFSTKNRGTGLGLAIVSHIVAEHNGTDPGRRQPACRGAFHGRNPGDRRSRSAAEAAGEAGPRSSAYEAPAYSGGGRRARDPPVLERRAGRRRLHGGDARRAERPAWTRCPGGGFELVLLDIWLPGMDGMEVLARIQEIPFAERPVVVVISGHGSIEAAVKATKLGAFDFLEKPLSIGKSHGGGKERAGPPQLRLENSAARRRHRLALPDHRARACR